MAKKQSDFFWASFTDLMISLFFVMLVLFAVLNKERVIYEEDAKYLLGLKEIDNQIEALKETEAFEYEEAYKRFLLTREITFKRDQHTITDEGERDYLLNVGKILDSLIATQQNDSVRYLVLIEGMASRTGDRDHNFLLSYRRAYEVYQIWKQGTEDNIISFMDSTEVLVAGSGVDGVGRYPSAEEARNQRFIIQIIPKFRIETATRHGARIKEE